MRSLFRFWRNPDDPDNGSGAAGAPCQIRRNGDRVRAASPVASRRRPHWSAARAQSRLFTAYRVTASVAVLVALAGVPAAGQYAPLVTMRVTLPDGGSQQLTAPESGLATVTLKDGSEYGFRPTIQDSRPWDRIVVTVFRMATADSPTQAIGDVEVRRGGPELEVKTTPAFKIAVSNVSAAADQTTTTN
jgi:hypothetical protein